MPGTYPAPPPTLDGPEMTSGREAPMPKGAKRYRVTGMMIAAKTMTLDGVRFVHLMAGAPLPPDVEQDHIDHLLSHNLIEEIAEPAPPAPAPEPEKEKEKEKEKPSDQPPPVTTVTEVKEEKTVTEVPKAEAPKPAPPTPPGRVQRTHQR